MVLSSTRILKRRWENFWQWEERRGLSVVSVRVAKDDESLAERVMHKGLAGSRIILFPSCLNNRQKRTSTSKMSNCITKLTANVRELSHLYLSVSSSSHVSLHSSYMSLTADWISWGNLIRRNEGRVRYEITIRPFTSLSGNSGIISVQASNSSSRFSLYIFLLKQPSRYASLVIR